MGLDAEVVAGAVAVGGRLENPVDVAAHFVQELARHHGDLGGVDAVGAEKRAAPAFRALVEVHEPFLDHVFFQLARAGQLAERLGRGRELAPVDGAQKFRAQHRHVLRVAAADEEVALVGAGAAAHAHVHEDLERAIFFQLLAELLHDEALPVGRKLPVLIHGAPFPGIGHAQVLENVGLGRVAEITRPKRGLGVHPRFDRRGVVDLDEFFRWRILGHGRSSLLYQDDDLGCGPLRPLFPQGVRLRSSSRGSRPRRPRTNGASRSGRSTD